MSCVENENYDIEIVQGETFELSFKVEGIDLTGASASMVIASMYPEATPVFTLSSPANITITVTTPVTNQLVLVTIPASQTTGVTIDGGQYDLFVTLANGKTRKLVKGAVTTELSLPRVT